MAIRKTVTEKVLIANRANAKKSTGPRSTEVSSQNSFKHGLLTKKLHFGDDEQRAEFNALLRELRKEQIPDGAAAQILVEDAALCIWKLRKTADWDLAEIEHRRQAGKALVGAVIDSFDNDQLDLFDKYAEHKSPVTRGWDCESLVVRTATIASEGPEKLSLHPESKSGHVQLEAKLCSSLDTVLRYQATIRRDLYRALSALREIRRERREGSQ
jgi:hypothetical protein